MQETCMINASLRGFEDRKNRIVHDVAPMYRFKGIGMYSHKVTKQGRVGLRRRDERQSFGDSSLRFPHCS